MRELLTFEGARSILATWTSMTAHVLRDGIAKLEAHVEELRTGLQTVRRERDEALASARDLRHERDAASNNAEGWRAERDRAVGMCDTHRKLQDAAIRRNVELIDAGNRVLRELERADTDPGLTLEAQVAQVVNALKVTRVARDQAQAALDAERSWTQKANTVVDGLLAKLTAALHPAFAPRDLSSGVDALIERLKKAEDELHTERMRLSACGVVAQANTRASAARARDMHPDYKSASCNDVARAVDREMELREALERPGRTVVATLRGLDGFERHLAVLDPPPLIIDVPTSSGARRFRLAERGAAVLYREMPR